MLNYYKIKNILTTKFVKNTAILMSGTAISQLILIGTSPLLSRIYEPSYLGVLGVFTAIVNIIYGVITWRYEEAIVIPKEEEDGANLFFLALFITMLMAFLTFLFVLFGGNFLATKLKTLSLVPLLWLLPVYVVFLGIYSALGSWSTRRKQFKSMSISKPARSIASVGLQTWIGLTEFKSVGLVGGQLAGHLTATFVLIIQTWRNEKNLLLRYFNYNRIKNLAFKYSSFPKYASWQTLINSLSQNAPFFILAYFYEPKIVGFYMLTYKILYLPVDMIGQSFRQVYFQKVSEVYNRGGNVYLLLKKATLGLVAIGIIPNIIIFLGGPKLFSFIFGNEWYTAGIYARCLVIWIFTCFINIPAVMTARVYMLQSYLLIYELALLLRVLILCVTAVHLEPTTSLLLYSITTGIFNLSLIIGMVFLSKRRCICLKEKCVK